MKMEKSKITRKEQTSSSRCESKTFSTFIRPNERNNKQPPSLKLSLEFSHAQNRKNKAILLKNMNELIDESRDIQPEALAAMVEIQVKKKHKLTPYEIQNMLFSDQLTDNQYVRIAPVIKPHQHQTVPISPVSPTSTNASEDAAMMDSPNVIQIPKRY